MSSNIRLRRASVEDIPFLARIEHIASVPPFERSFWEELLEPIGTPVLAFHEAILACRASRWGEPEDFLVLEERGIATAACAIYLPEPIAVDRRMLRLERLSRVCTMLGWDEPRLFNFVEGYEGRWPREPDFLVPPAQIVIETVAVLPEAQGRGLGRRLIEEAQAEVARRGHAAVGITVVNGNDRARRLYETCGFEPITTWHRGFFDKEYPGVTTMRARLPARV